MLRRGYPFVSLIAFLVILFVSSMVSAAEISVFGSETFTRQSGSPVTLTRTFDVPVERDGVVRLDNGLEDDTTINELVSSSVITLNGVVLFDPSELNQNVSTTEEQVTYVQGTNTLTVELRGKPGGTLALEAFAFNENPTASFTATPTSGPVPLTVNFDASASSDLDNDISDYDWTFGDAGIGTGVTTAHTYTTPGTFTATLTVTDDFGVTAQATETITVINTAPVASFTATPTTGDAPVTVNVDASASTDAENNIATYDWDFGEPGATATGVTASHVYSTPGTYTITLTVTDAPGLFSTATETITVRVPNTAPVASFTAVPTTGDAPLSVVLDSSGSTDAENNITTYAWDFGDSTTGSGITASHVYGSPGSYVVTLTVTDAGGLFSSTTQTITVTSPLPVADFTADVVTGVAPLTVNFDASASTDPDNNITNYDWEFEPGQTGTGVTTSHTFNTVGTFVVTLTVTDSAGGSSQATITITVNDPLPPIPGAIPNAPPLVDNVSYNVATNTEFLYTGANPVQTGVAPGTIEAVRAAILRGQVFDEAMQPLAGVTVTVLNHPEYGQTLSRADGYYDLAVNGGSQLTAKFTLSGYAPAFRSADVPWQGYAVTDHVSLVALDANVTTVDLSTITAPATAQSSLVTDSDGSRRSTVMFMPGTTASMVVNGTPQAITTLNVRATEFTVGDNGPERMPAPLPPTSAYTYAVEYSVDEAIAAGASEITFSQPVYAYVDNFLDVIAGTSVPVGALNNATAKWEAEPNGIVIGITGVTSGAADIDLNGDEISDAADVALYAGLNITLEEREALAALYPTGGSLWRVPVTHFSSYDWNFALGIPAEAIPPGVREAFNELLRLLNKCEKCEGSIIQAEGQILGEDLPVTGTPYTLHYNSDRVPGFQPGTSLNIPLMGDTIPPPLGEVELTIDVAGRRFQVIYDTLAGGSIPDVVPNLSHHFQWDGLDAYGREVTGGINANIRIRYLYPADYQNPIGFAGPGSAGQLVGRSVSGGLSAIASRDSVFFDQEYPVFMTLRDYSSLGLGGWTVDINHVYDPFEQVLQTGAGPRRSAQALNPVQQHIAGDNSGANPQLWNAQLLVEDSKGNLYVNTNALGTCRIMKIDTLGNVTEHLGPDPGTGFARCDQIRDMDIDANDTIYFADNGSLPSFNGIFKVDAAGNFSQVAGSSTSGFSGDGGLATNAQFAGPNGVAVAPDGSIYVADNGNHRVRRIGPDGIIRTVLGNGIPFHHTQTNAAIGDGVPGTQVNLASPQQMALDSNGNLFVWSGNQRIFKLDKGGFAHIIAGRQNAPANTIADGNPVYNVAQPGTDVWVDNVRQLATGPDGNLLLAEDRQLRRITPDGTIHPITRWHPSPNQHPELQIEGTPQGTAFGFMNGVGINNTGRLIYVSNHQIRKFVIPFGEFTSADILLPSEDGSMLYVFDATGRHKQSVNTLTGATIFTFGYDSLGQLISITDGDNDVTTFNRDAAGKLVSITSPDGLVTGITLDSNGYLASATNPENETTSFFYSARGLLEQKRDARLFDQFYTYDSIGRLDRDTNPAAGYLDFDRVELSDEEYEVTATTAEGRVQKWRVETLDDGTVIRESEDSAGLVTTSTKFNNGFLQTLTPDGTSVVQHRVNDPRYGKAAPLIDTTISTPGGLTSTITNTRSFSGLNASNTLQFGSMTDTLNINGRVFSSTFTQSTLRFDDTSAQGRTTTTFVDDQGRTAKVQVPGLFDTDIFYDGRGRLQSISQGNGSNNRNSTISYNSQGFIQSMIDSENQTVSFTYDDVGRILTQTLPDLRVIYYSYDDNGNLASITPPGRPQHGFTYTAVNLEDEYTPPIATGTSQPKTFFQYNLDKQIALITRPDGKSITFNYDTAGRLNNYVIPSGSVTLLYNPSSGNLESISSSQGESLFYTYDGALPLSEAWNGTVNGSVSRLYDNSYRIVSRSVNGSNAIIFSYDDDDLLTSAGSETLTYVPMNGLLSGTTLGVVSDNYNYSQFAELVNYSAKANGTNIFSTSFIRDNLGRITKKTETANGITSVYDYTYDLAGRLETVTKDNVLQKTYTYDLNSNRTNNGAVYDNQDRLTATNTATYTYTDNGELLTKVEGPDTTSYVYDVLGNLTQVTLPNGDVIDYIIDGQNRRVGKKRNGTLEKQWLYKDRHNLIAELDGNGNLLSRFVYGAGGNVPDYFIKGGLTYRIIFNHLGSPRFVVDVNSGTIVQELTYDVWGQVIFDTNPGFQPFGFAGGLYDQDTKLVRFGARDYDTEVGRWTTKDPLRFDGDGANLYGYTHNNPINLIDPSGLVTSIYPGININGSKGFQNKINSALRSLNKYPAGRRLLSQVLVVANASKNGICFREVFGDADTGTLLRTLEIGINLGRRETVNTTDGGYKDLDITEIVAHELGHTLGYGDSLADDARIIVEFDNPLERERSRRERGTYSRHPSQHERDLFNQLRGN